MFKRARYNYLVLCVRNLLINAPTEAGDYSGNLDHTLPQLGYSLSQSPEDQQGNYNNGVES